MAASVATAALLAACGQKGPLMLPKPSATAASAPSVPASSASAATRP